MKKFLLILLSFFAFKIAVNAQSYIYFSSSYYDSSENNQLEYISRLDLTTHLVEDYPPGLIVSNYLNYAIDPSGSYMAVYINHSGSFIYSCSDTSVYYELDDLFGAQFDEIQFSKKYNKLYIFCEDWDQNVPYTMSVFDLDAGQIIKTFALNEFKDNSLMQPSRSSFFSADQNKIYFYGLDTLTNSGQVWMYSTNDDSIGNKINLSDLGKPGSDGYDVKFGKEGKGIIVSYSAYNNPNRDFYYRIYDFDSDKGAALIYHKGYADAYFTDEGKFLILFDVDINSTRLKNTGTVEIYNTQTGGLIKSYSVPPGGIVYSFDNYPDDLYYVVDIDSPKRQIFHINADSLLNR
jgi:hypothetical protein